MISLRSIALVTFSTSLLSFPLFSLLLGEQSARAEENIGVIRQPLETYTKVRYCNGTSQTINAAIGYSPSFAAWNWRTLNPGNCRVITWKKYSGRVDFFVSVNSLGISGNRPAFQKTVGAGGNSCYRYVQNSNQLTFRPEGCPVGL